jgi:hypothetical protein
MIEDINNIVNDELNPCEFNNVDDFISQACEMLAYRYFESPKFGISDKESEKLYPSIVNLFSEHLTKVYNKRCGKELSESRNTPVPTSIRRRVSFDDMKQDMINLVDYELNPCEFDNVSDFVAEACDILSYNYIGGLDVPNKDRDKFFFFLVDTFGEDLARLYKQRCAESLKESVKKITIPENKLEQMIFKYLDTKFKDVKKSEGQYFDVIFKIPGYDIGMVGYNDLSNVLNINGKLIDDVFSFVPIEKMKIMELIANYIVMKYRVNITRVMNPVIQTQLWR